MLRIFFKKLQTLLLLMCNKYQKSFKTIRRNNFSFYNIYFPNITNFFLAAILTIYEILHDANNCDKSILFFNVKYVFEYGEFTNKWKAYRFVYFYGLVNATNVAINWQKFITKRIKLDKSVKELRKIYKFK